MPELQEILYKSNAKLLAEFKWGAQGEADFNRFMILVRELNEEKQITPLVKEGKGLSDIIEKETVDYFDLLELLEEMENRGYKKKDEVWRNYICERGVSNDTIFRLDFDYYMSTGKENEYKMYFKGVNKLLGLPESNDGIMVKAFW